MVSIYFGNSIRLLYDLIRVAIVFETETQINYETQSLRNILKSVGLSRFIHSLPLVKAGGQSTIYGRGVFLLSCRYIPESKGVARVRKGRGYFFVSQALARTFRKFK